jgi:hypothetical protein
VNDIVYGDKLSHSVRHILYSKSQAYYLTHTNNLRGGVCGGGVGTELITGLIDLWPEAA